MALRKIAPEQLPGNVIDEIRNQWMLLSAGTMEDFNFMTINWGMIGELWYQDAVTVYVRDSRYTMDYMKKNARFAVIRLKSGHQKALNIAGSQSGRDIDKVEETGLTPVELDGVPTFAEAAYTLVCETMYAGRLEPSDILQADIRDKAFPEYPTDPNAVDKQIMFVGRIVGAYINE